MWRKHLIWPLARLTIFYIMLLGVIYLIQDRLLHKPGTMDLAVSLVLAKDLRMSPWPDAAAPRGWLRETATTMATATRGTVVMFHGNEGHALQRNWFADEMEKLGYRTLLAEYPGYGHRPGATDEKTLSTDATEVIAALRQSFAGPLIVAGKSLGAGVASAALARNHAGVTGVMLMTPWDNLGNVASYHYPILPARLLLRDRYDSVANLSAFKGPKFVLIAGRDSVIPAEFGNTLFNSLEANKKLLEMPNSDHNDCMSEMRPENWQEAMQFLSTQ